MSSTTNKMTMEVPQELFSQLQEHLAMLQMTESVEPTVMDGVSRAEEPVEESEKEMEQACVVKKVINHRVNSETGEFSFNILFADGSIEWVEDSKCDCELKIGEYMATGNLRTIHLFCRVSTKDQASSTSTSLEAQEAELRSSVANLEGTYRIRVHKLSESAYKRMPQRLQDIGSGAIAGDMIYVWRVDRLSRNICATLSWAEEMHSRGVHLVAYSEKLNYRDHKLAFIQGILDAQKEAELLGNRIALSYKHKRDRGDEGVGNLPFGKKYHHIMTADGSRTERKVIIDHPAEILLIKRVKESRKCPKSLAEELNRGGIKKRGRKWSANMIKKMKK
jgi:DNA invertase Pin-like site-specific DNA recombinase